jgi:ArsR family transcriptional regulator
LYEAKSDLLKALAHPLRLQIVRACWWGDATTSAAWRRAGAVQSTISQHLMPLKAAGVVRCERSGNEMYF